MCCGAESWRQGTCSPRGPTRNTPLESLPSALPPQEEKKKKVQKPASVCLDDPEIRGPIGSLPHSLTPTPTPRPDPGSLTSSTPSKFLFPEESGGKSSRTQIPQGTQAEAAPTLLPQSRWGHARSRRGAGPPTAAARLSGGGEDSVPTPETTPWGHDRPLGHSRPGSRPRVSLLSDLPAAKCVTSARRSGDTCCRPRRAASISLSLGPRQAMAPGRAVSTAVGQRSPEPEARGSGLRGAVRLGPQLEGAGGARGRSAREAGGGWGPYSPGSADSPRARRLLLANILV